MKQPSWIRSLNHAIRGVRTVYQHERSFRVQLGVAVLVGIAAVFLPISKAERAMVAAVIITVLVLELMNSAVERLVDIIRPRIDERAGDIKDVMAGAVLLGSILAAIIGVMIFWPPVRHLLVGI